MRCSVSCRGSAPRRRWFGARTTATNPPWRSRKTRRPSVWVTRTTTSFTTRAATRRTTTDWPWPARRERLDPGFALNDARRGRQSRRPGGAEAGRRGHDAREVHLRRRGHQSGANHRLPDPGLLSDPLCAGRRQPAASAPGDPADGAQNNIGAIGGADDQFGKLCADGDVGKPDPDRRRVQVSARQPPESVARAPAWQTAVWRRAAKASFACARRPPRRPPLR